MFSNKKKNPSIKKPTADTSAAPKQATPTKPKGTPTVYTDDSTEVKPVNPTQASFVVPLQEEVKPVNPTQASFVAPLQKEPTCDKGKASIRMTSKQKATNPVVLRGARQDMLLSQARRNRCLKHESNRLKWSLEQVSAPRPNMPHPAPPK
jgi:cytoskeletal protein RodZ